MDRVEVARFVGPQVPGSEVQEAADKAMADILKDSDLLDELSQSGLDKETLLGVKFSVEQRPGIDPASAILIIALAASGQLTANSIQALWGAVLRRIRKSKGHDALGKEE
jgi:hypothetical protein